MKALKVLSPIILAALLIAAFAVLPVAAQAPVAEQITVPIYSAVGVTTGTVNTASPNVDQYGRDVSAAAGWGSVDIFFTSDISGTGYVTATAQVSADGVNWATATQEYWNGSAIASANKARSLSADGTTYMNAPLAGEYWRVSIQTTGTATNTIKATLRR